MSRPLGIAGLDVKRMVRDRTFFFWSIAFPVMLILLFGNLYRGDGEKPKAGLVVVNHDNGAWGEYLISSLYNPEMTIETAAEAPEKFNRLLEIPADFSTRIQAMEARKLQLIKDPDASREAAVQVEVRIIQALVRLVAGVVLQAGEDDIQPPAAPIEELVTIRSGFPPGTITRIPSGFDHVIPGIMVQMLMILIIIYGGITVMTDRQNGVLARILFSPASKAHLWCGKFLGRLAAGLVQALILVVIGLVFFKLNLGNPLLSLLIILFFSASMASLSIFLGSVFRKEQVIIGLAILLSNIFAALGGCWWPMEVVPPSIRTMGMTVPTWWAMDAFHQVIFFHKGMDTLVLHYAVLLGYTALFSFLAIRYFKIKN